MSDEPSFIEVTGEPDFRIIESKLIVESERFSGGDWAKNIGGSRNQKRITFEGYVTPEMYSALIDAITKAVDE